ncbi:MAG: hypothetical protein IPK82_16365 [Polyangiaceae bacterium]|nr:hypothetical protein [Polyangiaceae bacterium]
MRWLDLMWTLPLLTAMGCGNTVTTNNTGGGGGSGGAMTSSSSTGGSTTSSTVTTTTTSSSTSTSSSTTTSGTGGGTVCDQACGKAEMCGLPGGQCGQFVDCGTMQGVCFANCVNDPSVDCGAIFAALQGNPGPLTTCIQGCQGGGTGGAGTGGAGGGPGSQCQQCGQNQCAQAAFQCFQTSGQAECQGWLSCVDNCLDAACVDGCTMMFPGGAVIEDCACTNCAMECGAICNGTSGTGGAGTGGAGGGNGDPMACQQCGQQQCGNEVQQCFGNFQECQSWLNCTQGCQDKMCLDNCSAMFPTGTALGVCLCNSCASTGCGYLCQ